MGTATLISVAEYLSTDYSPDCDYIDGEVLERNVGEGSHADAQTYLAGLFLVKNREWQIHPRTEQRLQVAAQRYRIPDVTVMRATDPRDEIIRVPPILCVEVLSKGQRLSEIQERADDYFAMGVEHVWAIDPLRRVAYYGTPTGFKLVENGLLQIHGTPIEVKLDELFGYLSE